MPSVRSSAGPNWATKMAPEMPQPKSSHPGQAEHHSDHEPGPRGVQLASFECQHLLGVTLTEKCITVRDGSRTKGANELWLEFMHYQRLHRRGAQTGKTWIFTIRTQVESTTEDSCLGLREEREGRIIRSNLWKQNPVYVKQAWLFWLDQRLDHMTRTDV